MSFNRSAVTGLTAWFALHGFAGAKLPPVDPLRLNVSPDIVRPLDQEGLNMQQKEQLPLSTEEFLSILTNVKAILAQSQSARAIYEHAKTYHCEVRFTNFQLDPLFEDSQRSQLGYNSLNSNPALARVELNTIPLFAIIDELQKGKVPNQTVVAMLARGYEPIVVHELAHHKVHLELNTALPKIEIGIQCTEHEGIALAEQAIFLEEAMRSNPKVDANETFNSALSKGDKFQTFKMIFIDDQKRLLDAAQAGREEFKRFAESCFPIPFSKDNAIERLNILIDRLSKVTLSEEQKKKYMTEEELQSLLQSAKNTATALKDDPDLGNKVKDHLTKLYDAQLDRMAVIFKWKS